MSQRLVLVATALSLTLTLGCDAPGPKVYAVKGKLTINGAPPQGVQIHFHPTDNFGTMGSGIVKADGSYEALSGTEGRSGLAAGKYKVVLQQTAPSGADAAKAYMSSSGSASSGPGSATPMGPALSFPKEYSAAETSPKEVEVKAQPNTINIDIKS